MPSPSSPESLSLSSSSTMRAHPLAALIAAWLVASPTLLLTHATPNALAAPHPALSGPSLHVDRRQEVHDSDHAGHEHDAHDQDDTSTTAPSQKLGGGGHDHMHFTGPPMTELNETLILLYHKPTPPSYGTHDFEDSEISSAYPGLMGLHAVLMSSAFFVALPVGASRSRLRRIHPNSHHPFVY